MLSGAPLEEGLAERIVDGMRADVSARSPPEGHGWTSVGPHEEVQKMISDPPAWLGDWAVQVRTDVGDGLDHVPKGRGEGCRASATSTRTLVPRRPGDNSAPDMLARPDRFLFAPR